VIREQFKKRGVRVGTDFDSSESEAIYQCGNLCDYTRIVFSSNIAEVHALDELAQEISVLLMDNWSSHITSDMIGLLIEERVPVRAFAPYTTQIFQVFDVTLFDVLKRYPRCELPFGDGKVSVKCLMKVYHGFKRRTVDSSTPRAL
jgi:hypothetical protein